MFQITSLNDSPINQLSMFDFVKDAPALPKGYKGIRVDKNRTVYMVDGYLIAYRYDGKLFAVDNQFGLRSISNALKTLEPDKSRRIEPKSFITIYNRLGGQ